MDLAPEAAAKTLIYASLLLAIGANAARWLLAPRLNSQSGDVAADFDHRLVRLCTAAASVLLVAQLVRALAHTASAFGWSDAFSWSQFSVIALESRWGEGWRVQVAASAVLVIATFFIRINRLAGWTLTSAAVIACAVSMPRLGHAATNNYGVLLHSAHLLGAGVWLGTLACILLVRQRAATDLLRHFAPFALTGAGIVVVAGAIAAVEYVGSFSNLWATPYGRTLLLKLTFFAGVVACGFRNWRRWSVVPSDAVTNRRLEIAESALAFAIVVVTSVLTELGHP
jgi:copper resistance protein D